MPRIILAALLLFLITANAYADCAWILWKSSELMEISKKEGPRRNVEWELVKAWPSFSDCEGHKKRLWTVYAKDSGQNGEKVSYEFLYIDFGHGSPDDDFQEGGISYKFLCVPESIDPRGK